MGNDGQNTEMQSNKGKRVILTTSAGATASSAGAAGAASVATGVCSTTGAATSGAMVAVVVSRAADMVYVD